VDFCPAFAFVTPKIDSLQQVGTNTHGHLHPHPFGLLDVGGKMHSKGERDSILTLQKSGYFADLQPHTAIVRQNAQDNSNSLLTGAKI
jgi:hypothetical protein